LRSSLCGQYCWAVRAEQCWFYIGLDKSTSSLFTRMTVMALYCGRGNYTLFQGPWLGCCLAFAADRSAVWYRRKQPLMNSLSHSIGTCFAKMSAREYVSIYIDVIELEIIPLPSIVTQHTPVYQTNTETVSFALVTDDGIMAAAGCSDMNLVINSSGLTVLRCNPRACHRFQTQL
jgi:hypothetical protein